MSGDESDHRTEGHEGNRQYAIVRPAWRNEHVCKWVHTMDKVYIASRFQGDGRATRGNWPRIRHISGRIDRNARAVPGLPHNFYAPEFLASLDYDEQQELDIQPAFDMQFTERVKEYVLQTVYSFYADFDTRLARRFGEVYTRFDQPLPVPAEEEEL